MNSVHYNADMPKIIENLEERILQTAGRLFWELGYDQVSMRMLADNLSISPGTIYNYFATKEEIFTRIFVDSWYRTNTRLEEILTLCMGREDLDREALTTLYSDMKQRREVLLAILSSEWRLKTFGEKSRESLRAVPVDTIRTMFARVLGIPEDQVDRRDCVAFLHAVRGCLAHYAGNDQENIEYLHGLLQMMKARYL